MRDDQEPAGREDVDEQMRTLWPEMGQADAIGWLGLPLDRKRKAVRRLKALLMIENHGARDGIVADAIGLSGMGTSTFYAMRKRWSTERTLANLGIYAHKKAPEGPPEQAAAFARAMVDRTLAAHRDAGPAFVAKELAKAGLVVPSTTLQRMVRDAHRGLPIEVPFGRRLIFDNAGADLVDRRGKPQRLCAVLDDDTGLLLGWFLSDEDVHRGYLGAASHALQDPADFQPGAKDLGGMKDLDVADVPIAPGLPAIDFVVSSDQFSARRSEWRRLEGVGSTIRRRPNPGRRIVSALGERIGPVWIGSGFRPDGRSYRSGRMVKPLLASVELHTALGEAIHERNLDLLSRIARHGDRDRDGCVKDGRDAIAIVEGALRAVVPRGFHG